MLRAVIQIFHRQGAGRPVRAAWVLEEAGEPYEVIVMSREECSGEEHRARHPLGRVPVLEDGSGPLFESVAICLQLADTHPQAGLLPAVGSHERGLAYQWSVFVPAELEPPLMESFIFAQSDPERAAAARERGERALRAVASALAEAEFLVADRFGVADVMVGSTLSLLARGGGGAMLGDTLSGYLGRLQERPAFKAALARTG